ncbi:MAG: hypothetical protein JW818_03045, partial [Pirellulales bacterium]|nr:hypothetical protein [Pirellulales bacterium]
VDRASFLLRGPRRWEVVALRDPSYAKRLLVKRVVGLPGEAIQIRDGDVYADGRICRKPLATQRAMAVLVHDASFYAPDSDERPRRWRPEPPEGTWGSAEGRFAHPEQSGTSEVDWLVYHHEQPTGVGFEESPVMDDALYDQSRPRRSETARAVTDLMLAFRVARWSGKGDLVVRATDGQNVFETWINPAAGRFTVRRNNDSKPVAEGNIPKDDKRLDVEVSLFDRQFTLALQGEEVAAVPYEAGPMPRRPVAWPLAVGVRGLGVEIVRLRVFRDVYYTKPLSPSYRWGIDKPAVLPPGAYFILGDNSLISDDSRSWPAGPEAWAKLLVGKPFVIWFPRSPVVWGRWRFRVPDPTRIRYIH